MGFELNRLMRERGVATPGVVSYSGSTLPVAPVAPGAGATTEQTAQYNTALAAYNAGLPAAQAKYDADMAAYNKYRQDYEQRVMGTPQYLQSQFNTSTGANVPPVMTFSPSQMAALRPGGIGLDQMNRNIQGFFATNPAATREQVVEQQQKYGISDLDIRNAMGQGFQYGSGNAGFGSSGMRNAMAPGGIGLQQYNKNIRDFFSSYPDVTADQVAQAKAQYGVSDRDIYGATGSYFGNVLRAPTYAAAVDPNARSTIPTTPDRKTALNTTNTTDTTKVTISPVERLRGTFDRTIFDKSPTDKAAYYNSLLAAGYDDATIRAAIGAPLDSYWTALQGIAAQLRQGTTGSNATTTTTTPTTTTTTPTTTTTTTTPTITTTPVDRLRESFDRTIFDKSATDKAAYYNSLLAAGYDDATIRAAINAPLDSNWTALQGIAAQLRQGTSSTTPTTGVTIPGSGFKNDFNDFTVEKSHGGGVHALAAKYATGGGVSLEDKLRAQMTVPTGDYGSGAAREMLFASRSPEQYKSYFTPKELETISNLPTDRQAALMALRANAQSTARPVSGQMLGYLATQGPQDPVELLNYGTNLSTYNPYGSYVRQYTDAEGRAAFGAPTWERMLKEYDLYSPAAYTISGEPQKQFGTGTARAEGGLAKKYKAGGKVKNFQVGGLNEDEEQGVAQSFPVAPPSEMRGVDLPPLVDRGTPAQPVTASPAAQPVVPRPSPSTPVSPAATDLMSMLQRYTSAESPYASDLAAARAKVDTESKAFENLLKTAMKPGSTAPDKTEMYFRLAAAFGSPTRTGHFTENLGLASKEIAEFAKETRASKKAEQQLALQLGLEAQKMRMQGAREELGALRALAGEEMKDKRAVLLEYLKSGRPQSEAGKAAVDAGLTQGTPEFNKFVNDYIDDKVRSGNLLKEAMVLIAQGNLRVAEAGLNIRQSAEERARETAKKLTPAEVKLKADTEDKLLTIDSAMTDLGRAFDLNKTSFDTTLKDAATRKLMEETGSKDPRVVNTRELENLLKSAMISSASQKLTGVLSDSDIRLLQSIAGLDAKSKTEREQILKNAYRALRTARTAQRRRLDDITAGLYRETNPTPAGLEEN